jgi:hypothetical protein
MEELEALLETGGVAAVEIAASALARRGTPPKNCPSCGKPMIGPYCAMCGQPDNTHRRTLKHLAEEFVKDIASFDSRILRTGRALLFRPGELPSAFRDGRTQPYVPAVRLYLFVSLLFFLFLSATGLAFIQFGLQVQTISYTHDNAGHVFKNLNGKPTLVDGLRSDAKGNLTSLDGKPEPLLGGGKADGKTNTVFITTRMVFFERPGTKDVHVAPDVRRQLDVLQRQMISDKEAQGWFVKGLYATLVKLETNPAALNGPLTTWIPRILFVLLPAFAGVLALFYRGRRKDFLFVDHLVFSFTTHSFAFVLLIGAAIVAQLLPGHLVAGLTWIVLSVYLFLSLKRFYGQSWTTTGLKFVGITFIYTTFCLAPALFVALAASVVAG